jgi:hypothetical protein
VSPIKGRTSNRQVKTTITHYIKTTITDSIGQMTDSLKSPPSKMENVVAMKRGVTILKHLKRATVHETQRSVRDAKKVTVTCRMLQPAKVSGPTADEPS